MNSLPTSILIGTLGALLGIASSGSLPALSVVLQGAGLGGVLGMLVVLRRERRDRVARHRPDTDLRWTIVARWTVLCALGAAVVEVVVGLLRG